MRDLARLETDLATRVSEPWARHHLASFRDAYFAAFDDDDIVRHLARIVALTKDHPVSVEVRPAGDRTWLVEVVGFDAFQLLSTTCGLLAVYGLVIVEGAAFTSHEAPAREHDRGRRGPASRRLRSGASARGPLRYPTVVDRFRVQRANDAEDPNWDEFRAELSALARLLRADQSAEVDRRLIARFVAALEAQRSDPDAMKTVDVTVDPAGSDFATVVGVKGRDVFGFLALTANALAHSGVTIVQAEIRSHGGAVDDTFWVTDRFGRRIELGPHSRELRLSLTLIAHSSAYLPHATNPASALVHFSRFAAETMSRLDWSREFVALDKPEVLDALVRVLGESDFLWEDYLHAQPENLLPMIDDPSQWRSARSAAQLAADRDLALSQQLLVPEKAAALREFRDREFFRAGVRAILGQSDGPEGLSAELSAIADCLLQGADAIAREQLGPEILALTGGCPVDSALFALGKCGGREIGFGSDLELMLVYDDRELAAEISPRVAACFDRYVTVLRQVLATRRGGTFDVDFRLRPYGRAGPPATAISAFAQYYRAGGPAWSYERQALIKLRAIAGNSRLAEEVGALRDRFVYGPEPFDVEGCRRLRRLQVEQLVRPGTLNAKYSVGGLVDLEYFVQGMQIAHGSSDPTVRTPSTGQAIEALTRSGRLPPERGERLLADYRSLRALIDALRVVRGSSKDLAVPTAGSEEFSRLARRLRRSGPAELHADLLRTFQEVHNLWKDASALLSARP
jgi:glutamate-ammonia-ligase adenylyltransferase